MTKGNDATVTTTTLRFADFDALGIAHHTTVLHAADTARLDLLTRPEHRHLGPMAITRLNVEYVRPVRPDVAALTTESAVEQTARDTWVVTIDVSDDQGRPVATVYSTHRAEA